MSLIPTVTVLQYNNYYNRLLKIEVDYIGYIQKATKSFVNDKINFNPNDGIETTLVWGTGFAPDDYRNYDYLIFGEINDETNQTTIISRWFIMESIRTRAGQYRLILKRDILADTYSKVLEAPVYVEKGMIQDADSPLLLNHESLQVNQVKIKEETLEDSTMNSWLVIYLQKGILGSHETVTVPQLSDQEVYKTLTTPIASWEYYDYVSTDFKVASNKRFQLEFFNIYELLCYRVKAGYNNPTLEYWIGFTSSNLTCLLDSAYILSLAHYYQDRVSYLETAFATDFPSYKTETDLAALKEYDGKKIKDSDGKYFNVRVEPLSSINKTIDITSGGASTLFNLMFTYWTAATAQTITPNEKAFKVDLQETAYRVFLDEDEDAECTIDFSEYVGAGTEDTPLFDIICMPYDGEPIKTIFNKVNGATNHKEFRSSKTKSLAIMNAIANQSTSLKVIDYQLIPYCPIVNRPLGNWLSFQEATETGLMCKHGGNIVNFIPVVPAANFTFNIEYIGTNINMNQSDIDDPALNVKFVNDCTMIRLCSPNYSTVFEMNLAKNGMSIEYFNVDVTLKPINPYFHVNPNFKKLYGQDFNDQRGLVLGGDYSLGIMDNAWRVYEIQNKNYQALFDRQIQNMNVNNAITRQEAGWQIAAGSVSGGVAGAAGGAMVGGGWGALAGGIIGTGSSLAGGIMDYANLNKRQQEQLKYSIDNFNLSLGNIRAMPNTITRTSAITANNKFFPFIEFYQCTDKEKEAYLNKIRYDGMTVGIIDKMANYVSPNNSNFFRARLIRLLDIPEDNHYLEVLNEELMKGVYI